MTDRGEETATAADGRRSPAETGYPALRELFETLRTDCAASASPAAADAVFVAAVARLREDGTYVAALRQDVRRLLTDTDATHLLTEAGVLSDEGLAGGIANRLGKLLAPAPPRDKPLEAAARELLSSADLVWIQALPPGRLAEWSSALRGDEPGAWEDPAEPASALVILATRISGGGMDPRLVERLPALEAWSSPFLALTRTVDRFAEQVANAEVCEEALRQETLEVIDRCEAQVAAFRRLKRTFGTTLHLSSQSLRMQQQLTRLRRLVRATSDAPDGTLALAEIALDLLRALCEPRPIRTFVGEKVALLAYLAVGRAAQKGSTYVVKSRDEYAGFLRKSLLGGALVAIFACLKIDLSHEDLAPVPQALIYGFNYAVCFVLIYLAGATLATKQPALTASRLASSLEGTADQEDFAELVRAIWHSQFISFVGNILGAAVFAALIAWLFRLTVGTPLIDLDEALQLAKKHSIGSSGTLWYAAIAGVLLSSAGFVAAWVDNAAIFHRVSERVAAGTGLLRYLPTRLRKRLAGRVEEDLGGLSGNITLGFMLGSAGAFGAILGLPIDIRHIAFSSSHATLSVLHAEALRTPGIVATLLAAVVLIGLINFLVSFGLTLWVALAARDIEGIDWKSELVSLWRLIRRQPVQFFIPLSDRSDR